MQHQRAVFDVFYKIKEIFGDYFSFALDKPFFIDARKSWSEPTVVLRQTLSKLHHQLTSSDESPRQPAICQLIVDLLPSLRQEAASPVITKARFVEFMRPHVGIKDKVQSEVSSTGLTSLFDKALQFLTGYASVLAFRQPQAQRFVVIDPQWLLSDIVGRLMAEDPLPGPWIHYDNGYAKKSDVISALETEHLSGEAALEMIADLGFCLEQKMLNRILNPSKLLDARPHEHWGSDPTMVVNAGRRLKCKGAVAISSAFFPHLQVHFYHCYLTDYDEKLPVWNGGIRLAAGKRNHAEALIEAHPANLSIDIIVRGRDGSVQACTELLDDLSRETLEKAEEISPGSQLSLFFLSRFELDKLSPAGLPSRPHVEYSAASVMRAIRKGDYVTDGNASSPENPHDLLLSPQLLDQISQLGEHTQEGSVSDVAFSRTISNADWRVILLRLAKAVSRFDECSSLARGLAVNDREGDIVAELRDVNPNRRPPQDRHGDIQHMDARWWRCADDGVEAIDAAPSLPRRATSSSALHFSR